ncbi:hypothetical protein EV210_12322 [Anaerospora hongkongensis]|uniref:Uncharacterized protein n=1 Tax=Anaerospora hongkongensis TaxID=244830 RepID=A0A4R1PR07_9FIRM|nr:hypothetical protein EV210_12322 [Anaerospora hongkongensis]
MDKVIINSQALQMLKESSPKAVIKYLQYTVCVIEQGKKIEY